MAQPVHILLLSLHRHLLSSKATHTKTQKGLEVSEKSPPMLDQLVGPNFWHHSRKSNADAFGGTASTLHMKQMQSSSKAYREKKSETSCLKAIFSVVVKCPKINSYYSITEGNQHATNHSSVVSFGLPKRGPCFFKKKPKKS